MEILSLSLEKSAGCQYDSLNISNGDTGELIRGPLCGIYNMSQPVFNTSAQHLSIAFTSDESVSGDGFQLHLFAQKLDNGDQYPPQSSTPQGTQMASAPSSHAHSEAAIITCFIFYNLLDEFFF